MRNNRRSNKRIKRALKPKSELTRQLQDIDTYIVDTFFNISDGASVGYDLYGLINACTDYTNLQATYGEFSFRALSVEFKPYFEGAFTNTDFAVGAFGVRQGVYDVTVNTKTAINVVREPGAILISNRTPWKYRCPILHNKFMSSTMTNTIVSDFPKINLYFGWDTVATTNTTKGMVRLRVHMACKSKLD